MSGENSTRQIGVKEPRQKIVKRPIAEIAPAAKRLKKVKELGRVGRTGEPAPIAEDLRKRGRNVEVKKD